MSCCALTDTPGADDVVALPAGLLEEEALGLELSERVTNHTTKPPKSRPTAKMTPICQRLKLSPP